MWVGGKTWKYRYLNSMNSLTVWICSAIYKILKIFSVVQHNSYLSLQIFDAVSIRFKYVKLEKFNSNRLERHENLIKMQPHSAIRKKNHHWNRTGYHRNVLFGTSVHTAFHRVLDIETNLRQFSETCDPICQTGSRPSEKDDLGDHVRFVDASVSNSFCCKWLRALKLDGFAI